MLLLHDDLLYAVNRCDICLLTRSKYVHTYITQKNIELGYINLPINYSVYHIDCPYMNQYNGLTITT